MGQRNALGKGYWASLSNDRFLLRRDDNRERLFVDLMKMLCLHLCYFSLLRETLFAVASSVWTMLVCWTDSVTWFKLHRTSL